MRAISAPHHLATGAGRSVLLQGGNAVDAAIAVVAAQGVVAPETCGLGGDLFALVHQPGWDSPRTLNSSGRAGSGVDPEQMRRDGLESIPLAHPVVATIPGCVDGLIALNDRFGTKDLGTLLAPAIKLAAGGFPVSGEQERAFAGQQHIYGGNPAVSDFYPGGSSARKGQIVTRRALAATLSELGATGHRNTFYLGRPGEDIVAAVGGLITPDDLSQSQAEWVEPFGVDVFGLTAWTTPPNSQGYLGPASLAIFEMLGPPDDPDDPQWWHLLIESYRCLAWERDTLVSDPASAPMSSAALADRTRLAEIAGTITATAGVWPERLGTISSTAYMCTSDSDGMVVSIIQSNYRGTGSPFGAARSGFLLQDRGLGFNLIPGHPNELRPGRRPLHTLSPTVWTKEDEPAWAIGTRGGDIQPQLVAQVAARVVGRGHSPEVAQAAPRWSMSEFGPGSGPEIALEPGLPEAVVEGLAKRGHRVSVLDAPQPGWGPISMIGIDGERRHTARDPRVETTSAIEF